MSKTLLGVTIFVVAFTVASIITLGVSVLLYHEREPKVIFALALCVGFGLILSTLLIDECIHEDHERHNNNPHWNLHPLLHPASLQGGVLKHPKIPSVYPRGFFVTDYFEFRSSIISAATFGGTSS